VAAGGAEAAGVLAAAVVVDEVARRWTRIAAETCFVAMSATEVEAELRGHAARLLRTLGTTPYSDGPAREVGAALVASRFTSPEMLGRTIELFDADVLASLGPKVAQAAQELLAPLRALRGALAAGYTQALRDLTLEQQESIRHADLAARAEIETASRLHEARFRAVFESAASGIAITDRDGTILEANPALRKMLGYNLRQLRQRRLDELVHGGTALSGPAEPAGGAHAGPLRGERPLAAAGGGILWAQITTSAIADTRADTDGDAGGDGEQYRLTVVEDISDRRRMRARLAHQALHDTLTDLPNRALFFDRLREVLNRSVPRDLVGVLVIDIGGLTAVNDGLGHEVGDRLLVGVADRLVQEVARAGHLVARVDGDDFAVLLGPGTRRGAAEALARRLVAVLAEPFQVDDRTVTVAATVGAAEFQAAATDASAIVRAAQTALGWARSDRDRSWAGFDPERNEIERARRRLAAEMPAALDQGAFSVEFQPVVELSDGRVHAAEAQVRWHHPELGTLDPDRFLPLAEETGFIVPLGRWLLDEACRHAERWSSVTTDPPLLSINLAARQIEDPSLRPDVAGALARTGLPPEKLQLEVTERAVVASLDASAALRSLSDDGVRIAIDDFGAGYSNLAYLRRLPIRELKLAGPFVEGLGEAADHIDDIVAKDPPPQDGAVSDEQAVGVLVSLAHALGLRVTADGVQTAGQADRLRALGCDAAQGWHFDRPMAPGPFAAALELRRPA
jgi:diguanylate cyclase (GGDEF)-like protein/PAS domain S-box-containing protein